MNFDGYSSISDNISTAVLMMHQQQPKKIPKSPIMTHVRQQYNASFSIQPSPSSLISLPPVQPLPCGKLLSHTSAYFTDMFMVNSNVLPHSPPLQSVHGHYPFYLKDYSPPISVTESCYHTTQENDGYIPLVLSDDPSPSPICSLKGYYPFYVKDHLTPILVNESCHYDTHSPIVNPPVVLSDNSNPCSNPIDTQPCTSPIVIVPGSIYQQPSNNNCNSPPWVKPTTSSPLVNTTLMMTTEGLGLDNNGVGEHSHVAQNNCNLVTSLSIHSPASIPMPDSLVVPGPRLFKPCHRLSSVSYEALIVDCIETLTQIHCDGVQPKHIFEMLQSQYSNTLPVRFKDCVTITLRRAVQKGVLKRNSGRYTVNSEYMGSLAKGRCKGTRSPQHYQSIPVTDIRQAQPTSQSSAAFFDSAVYTPTLQSNKFNMGSVVSLSSPICNYSNIGCHFPNTPQVSNNSQLIMHETTYQTVPNTLVGNTLFDNQQLDADQPKNHLLVKPQPMQLPMHFVLNHMKLHANTLEDSKWCPSDTFVDLNGLPGGSSNQMQSTILSPPHTPLLPSATHNQYYSRGMLNFGSSV